jgi:hypothetical protein
MISKIEHGTRALPATVWRIVDDVWSQTTLVTISGGCGKLAQELMQVVTRLVRALGRRDAMQLAGSVLAAAGLSGLDADEFTRLAQAVDSPCRVDAQVVRNLAAMLAHSKRLENKLGPCLVLDTVVAQHRLVHRILDGGGYPDQLRRPLKLVDSNMASAIGGYLVGIGHPDEGRGYFELADTPAALDSAAAARSLAARTDPLP